MAEFASTKSQEDIIHVVTGNTNEYWRIHVVTGKNDDLKIEVSFFAHVFELRSKLKSMA